MGESLQELIERTIREAENGTVGPRIRNYTDYKTKYVVLKPLVEVRVELTEGKTYSIDVSDYFKDVIK